MDRHLPSVAIMIEVTSRQTECSHFNLDYGRMLAVALQQRYIKHHFCDFNIPPAFSSVCVLNLFVC